MNDVLTFAEIEAKFPREWILVENPETSDALEVLSGRVLAHSKERDEVYDQLAALRPLRFAILNTGTVPEDAVIIL